MLQVKCKTLQVEPIAHEVVFKDSFERTIQNCFRFVFMSYMYHKGLYLRDFTSSLKEFTYNSVHNNMCLTGNCTKNINGSLATRLCSKIGVDLQFLYNIAVRFLKEVDYNAISFTLDGSPVFFKAFKSRFGY